MTVGLSCLGKVSLSFYCDHMVRHTHNSSSSTSSGKTASGDEVTGKVTVPEVSHEMIDGHSEYTVSPCSLLSLLISAPPTNDLVHSPT